MSVYGKVQERNIERDAERVRTSRKYVLILGKSTVITIIKIKFITMSFCLWEHFKCVQQKW
jgi:hypothetical protein